MRTLFLILTFFFFGNCSDTNKKLTDKLNERPADFDKTVYQCSKDGELISNQNKLVTFNKLNIETQTALNKLDLGEIDYVVVDSPKCAGQTKMTLEIICGNEHLEFSPCIDTIHKQGDHDYIKETSIDIYYLNKNWTLWVDHDII
jgi:hypothetical protein